MKYFIDTEFHEYKKKPLIGKPIDTIELISIGIVNEGHSDCNYERPDNGSCEYPQREYYAICKDFDLKAAWNSYQRDEQTPYEKQNGFDGKKVYWLKENVLKPIWVELSLKKDPKYSIADINYVWDALTNKQRYYRMKLLVALYSKTREQIAEEIKEFTKIPIKCGPGILAKVEGYKPIKIDDTIEFYAYYADYDWVVFCWLFGRMIDLPNGFPMYCNDLQQSLDEKIEGGIIENSERVARGIEDNPYLYELDTRDNYPKQTNEHNALADAKWNKELYKFLNKL